MKIEFSKKELQRQMGNKIKEELSKELDGAKIIVMYVNVDYDKGRGYSVYIYSNEYNYKRIEVNYIAEATVKDYIVHILKSLAKGKYKEHIASKEEIYISQILEENSIEKLFVMDGYLEDSGSDNSIDLKGIDLLYFDKINCIMEITVGEEVFTVNLKNETIKSNLDEAAEPITPEFITKVIVEFNKLNYWAKLTLHEDTIFLLDQEEDNLSELVDIDNINVISLKNEELFIGFTQEDEHGFDCCSINKHGIEY